MDKNQKRKFLFEYQIKRACDEGFSDSEDEGKEVIEM